MYVHLLFFLFCCTTVLWIDGPWFNFGHYICHHMCYSYRALWWAWWSPHFYSMNCRNMSFQLLIGAKAFATKITQKSFPKPLMNFYNMSFPNRLSHSLHANGK